VNIRRFGRKILANRIFGPFRVHEGLPTSKQKEIYISRLRTLNENPEQKLIFEHLYTNLDALDNKSNSLIQFAATLVTIYSGVIALRLYDLHTAVSTSERYSFDLLDASLLGGAICIFIAGIAFLLVERVFWSSVEDIANPERHARNLLNVRDHRTVQYRIGWLFSIAAYFFLMLSLLIAVVKYVVWGAL
jgi:hypothetical protein